MTLALHNSWIKITKSIQWVIELASAYIYYVNLPFHKQNNPYRNSRKPKNRGWDSDPPPVDIYIPSPDIPPTCDNPKFFSFEISPEIFIDGITVEEFFHSELTPRNFGQQFYVPEIFVSENSLEM